MDEGIRKYRVLQWLIFGAFAIITIFSIKLQIFEGKKYHRLSDENRIKKKYVTAPRGNIYDRLGREIANTRPAFYVSVIPAFAEQSSIEKIAAMLEVDISTIQQKIKLEKNPYVSIKVSRDISFKQISLIEELLEDLPGVEVGIEPVRNYPYQDLFCHVLGYVSEITESELKQRKDYKIGDYTGRIGLEQQYEEQLRGTDGVDYIEVDAKGQELGKVSEYRPVPSTPGKDLYTTLDLELTDSTAKYLKDFARAAAVALNPQNGEIYVIYSKPGFDANRFVHGLTETEWQILNNPKDATLYNRATMSCYPIGSTIKPFVALTGLDAGVIDQTKRFDPCKGKFAFGNRYFGCWKVHGSLALIDAIVSSCDVYFYQLGRFLGFDALIKTLGEVGFGKLTGIDLPQEKIGILPDRNWMEKRYGKAWTEGHILNLSIGQGDILSTPLQLARAYTLFANTKNTLITPHLNKELQFSGTVVNKKEEALNIVRQALTDVVSRGTGMMAQTKDLNVAGKTGTAENPHGEDHSLFVGYAPAENPEILVCVVVENAGHGGSIAAPVVGKIIKLFWTINNQVSHEKH